MTFTTHRPAEITLATSPHKSTDVLVLGLAETGSGPVVVGIPASVDKAVAKRFGTTVADLAADLGAATDIGSVTQLPGPGLKLVVVGVGPIEVTPNALREAAGAALRTVAGFASKQPLRVAVSLDVTDPELARAVIEGSQLGSYGWVKITADPPPATVGHLEVIVPANSREFERVLQRGRAVAAAACAARDWVNTPANLLYPASFANDARDLFKGVKAVSVDVLDDQQLAAQGYGGLTAVGGGSSRGPRLLRIDYHPKSATRTIALVGKGITFDSGGLDIKPADSMYNMKDDMSGAAAVVTATHAIASLGLKVRVICYAALAENMPGGRAYRPSDVLTIYGGTTVENANTDAEGRLVLADALARASEDAPDFVIDVATLTGACMVALGLRTAGLMASDDATAAVVLDAAEAAGEDIWQLPLQPHLRTALDSKVADLKSGGARYGGASIAATFLRQFVSEDQAWAHLDIAGPAFNDGAPWGHVPSGGTGAGVATLVALASSLEG